MTLQQQIIQTGPADAPDGTELIPALQQAALVGLTARHLSQGSARQYAATITQIGAAHPEAVLLANTIGDPVWERIDEVHYELQLYAAFPHERTIYARGADAAGNYLYWIDENTMGLYVAEGDGSLVNYPVKIEVYSYEITPAPTGLTATPEDQTKIVLAWDVSPAKDGYKLEWSLDGRGWQVLYVGPDEDYSHEGLEGDTTVYYRLSAYKDGWLDSNYAAAEATTDPDVS
jgi:hypothetical protein